MEKKFNTNLSESIQDELNVQPLQVRVHDNFDRAFKAFRAIVQKERLLSNYKKTQSYEKPSDKKRRKKAESIRKLKEAEMKQQKINSGEYEREVAKKKKLKEQRMALRAKKQQEGNSQG